MKVLLLGIGLQGKAVVYDLDQSPLVSEIVAADLDEKAVEAYLRQAGCRKARAARLDASDQGALDALIAAERPHLLLSMLPAAMNYDMASAALRANLPYVSSSYAGRVSELDGEARRLGLTVLPEMGLDPGIDLVLGMRAVGELDEVHGLYSYGSGVPEPACADRNPLKYKITWTLQGVLNSYKRPARFLRDGQEVSLPPEVIFHPDHIHLVEVPGVGTLEAYPNGDAIHFVEVFGLGRGLRHMGRYAMRWPGHAQFWYVMSQLGFLEETPVIVGGQPVVPQRFLEAHLTPRLQYAPGERDLVILRVHAWGLKDGRQRNVIYELIDYRDLATGFFAMNRTVGFTASIAAQMVLSGLVREPGVLSPARHVPGDHLLAELGRRGITVRHRVED